LFAIAAILLTGCLGHPVGVEPVHNIEIDRYLGTWYALRDDGRVGCA
jgi:lipocalin